MKKILFVGRMSNAPSHRFRFEQYLPFLKENGFEYSFSNMFTTTANSILLSRGKSISKMLIILKAIFTRLRDLFILFNYDIIFVQREALVLGPPIFEWLFSKYNVKFVYDFDDSIWLPNVSSFNKRFGWLKSPDKTKTIIGLADMVFAGNTYLAHYASAYNQCIKIIPSTIDTDVFQPQPNLKTKYDSERICIGWSGSETTIAHFKLLEPVLTRLKKKYGDKIYFKVIGTKEYTNDKLGIQSIVWNKELELEDLSEIEIGIMPLPNDEWSKGKCGLKGLSYMAMEIATVMSPVGVNTEIINDGIDGFLALTEQEWIDKLSLLIDNQKLRERFGKKGREKVIENYSTKAIKENFINHLKAI